MTRTILALTFLFIFMVVGQANDIAFVRTLFFQATKSKTQTEIMFNYLKKIKTNNNPVLKGYYGITHMLLAKHGLNLFARLNNFNKGKEILEQAIAQDRSSVELRFLRLSVQLNVPSFLNYSSSIETDRKLITEKFPYLNDADLKTKIKEFYISKKMSI